MTARRALTVLLCLGGGLAGTVVCGQEREIAFSSEAAQVRLHVAVFDRRGVPVGNLTADDFEIYEDGVLQETGFVFSPADSPVDIAIVLDMSGSMADSADAASAAASMLADALEPADCLLFLPFAGSITEPVWVAGGEGVAAVNEQAVGARDQTALTDAVLAAQVALRARRVDNAARRAGLPVTASCGRQGDSHGMRRQLLAVVSDGMDSISRTSWNSLLDGVLESLVPVISIVAGKNRTLAGDSPWRRFSRRRMEMLAVASGGVFESLDSDSYGRLFDRLLEILRATYMVTFPRTAESRASSAAWRQVEVRIATTDARILAPSGYYASGGTADRARNGQALAARVLEVGSIDAAVSLLRDALSRIPGSWSVQRDLARALELQSETEEALEFALRATRLRPTIGHAGAARLAMTLGRQEVALEQAIRAAQAGDDVGELLDRLLAQLPPGELAAARRRLEAPRVYLEDTMAGDVRTFLRVREIDGVLARSIADSEDLALVRDYSRADYFVWFDIAPDARRLVAKPGRLRLNLPRQVGQAAPKADHRDDIFQRLRPRTLGSTPIEFGDSVTREQLDAALRAAIVELEGWIKKRQ